MSEVKVDTISERTTDGGVTIDGVLIKDGVATFQTAAGSPLVFEGATADDYETTFAFTDPTADNTITFPDSSFTVPTSGGLTTASQWRLTTDFTGDAAPIASNLEEVDAPVGFGVLGDSMTESSGIFTFPSSGYYLIRFHAYFLADTNSLYNRITIQTTTNDSTYAVACITSGAAGAANQEQGISTEYIFDVTDTTQCKCRFDVDVNAAGVTTKGDTDQNETFMTFTKLADT